MESNENKINENEIKIEEAKVNETKPEDISTDQEAKLEEVSIDKASSDKKHKYLTTILKYAFSIILTLFTLKTTKDIRYVAFGLLELAMIFFLSDFLITKSKFFNILNSILLFIFNGELLVLLFSSSYISFVMLQSLNSVEDLQGKTFVYGLGVVLTVIFSFIPIKHIEKLKNYPIIGFVTLLIVNGVLLFKLPDSYSPYAGARDLYVQWSDYKEMMAMVEQYKLDANSSYDEDEFSSDYDNDEYQTDDQNDYAANDNMQEDENLEENEPVTANEEDSDNDSDIATVSNNMDDSNPVSDNQAMKNEESGQGDSDNVNNAVSDNLTASANELAASNKNEEDSLAVMNETGENSPSGSDSLLAPSLEASPTPTELATPTPTAEVTPVPTEVAKPTEIAKPTEAAPKDNKKTTASTVPAKIAKNFPVGNAVPHNTLPAGTNVIVIFVEGLSNNIITDSRGIMPNLAAFKGECITAKNYYNHTFATYRGLQGQLYSGNSLNDQETNHLPSMMDVLKAKGYNTAFINVEPYNKTFTNYLNAMAFDTVISNLGGSSTAGSLSDGQAYAALYDKALEYQGMGKPFMLCLYSFGTHVSFDTDENVYGDGSNNFMNRYYNCDVQIGEFINNFKTSPLAKNTMLVITADHSCYADEDFVKTFPSYTRANPSCDQIPLYIYYNGITTSINANGRNSLDLAPTLLDLLGCEAPASFLGDSLYNAQNSKTIIDNFFWNPDGCFYTGDLRISNPNKDVKSYVNQEIVKYISSK